MLLTPIRPCRNGCRAQEGPAGGSPGFDTDALSAALAGGARAFLLYLLLATAASAALPFVRLLLAQREPVPAGDTLVAVAAAASALWLVASLSRTLFLWAAARLPTVSAIPWLVAPWVAVGLLAAWYLGKEARSLRVFARAPTVARRLALDPAPVGRRLALFVFAAATAAGVVGADLAAEEWAAAVALTLGTLLWFGPCALAVPLGFASAAGFVGASSAALLGLPTTLGVASATAVVLALLAGTGRFGGCVRV